MGLAVIAQSLADLSIILQELSGRYDNDWTSVLSTANKRRGAGLLEVWQSSNVGGIKTPLEEQVNCLPDRGVLVAFSALSISASIRMWRDVPQPCHEPGHS